MTLICWLLRGHLPLSSLFQNSRSRWTFQSPATTAFVQPKDLWYRLVSSSKMSCRDNLIRRLKNIVATYIILHLNTNWNHAATRDVCRHDLRRFTEQNRTKTEQNQESTRLILEIKPVLMLFEQADLFFEQAQRSGKIQVSLILRALFDNVSLNIISDRAGFSVIYLFYHRNLRHTLHHEPIC